MRALKAAVRRHARYRLVLAIDQVATPAGLAVAAVAAEPADADPIAHPPALHSVAQRVNDAGHFVSGHDGIGDTGEASVLGVGVAVADTAGLHPDARLPRIALRTLGARRRIIPAADPGDWHTMQSVPTKRSREWPSHTCRSSRSRAATPAPPTTTRSPPRSICTRPRMGCSSTQRA